MVRKKCDKKISKKYFQTKARSNNTAVNPIKCLLMNSKNTSATKCSCITAGNLGDISSPQLSPWSHDDVPWFGNHCKCRPGYLEDAARELKIQSRMLGPPAALRLNLRRRKSSTTGVEYKFSHLGTAEYINAYNLVCCSLSKNDRLSVSVKDETPHLVDAVSQSPNTLQLTVPASVKVKRVKSVLPSLPDVWCSNSSTVPQLIHVRGSGLTAESSTKQQERHVVPRKYDGYQQSKGINDYRLISDPIQEIMTRYNPDRQNFNSSCKLQTKRLSFDVHKSDATFCLQKGLVKELQPKIQSDIQSGRLLSARFRAKSDAGKFFDDSGNISETLQSRQLISPLEKPQKLAKPNNCNTRSYSESNIIPNLITVVVRQPLSPPVIPYYMQEPALMIGKQQNSEPIRLKQPSVSARIKHRISLNEFKNKLAKNNERKYDHPSCFRRSAQRKLSKKWMFLDETGEVKQYSLQTSIQPTLDDILNGE